MAGGAARRRAAMLDGQGAVCYGLAHDDAHPHRLLHYPLTRVAGRLPMSEGSRGQTPSEALP